MLTKSRIILLGVMIAMVAVSAIPVLSPSVGFSSDSETPSASSEGTANEGIVFTSGFEAASATPAANPGSSQGSSGSTLVQELERALARLEQLTPRRIEAPRPVQIQVITPAPAEIPIANSVPAAEPQSNPTPAIDYELQAREQLRAYLDSHPIRGCIRGSGDDLLLLEGLRLRLGEKLGASQWSLAELTDQGAIFGCGAWRACIAWPVAQAPQPKPQAPQEDSQ